MTEKERNEQIEKLLDQVKKLAEAQEDKNGLLFACWYIAGTEYSGTYFAGSVEATLLILAHSLVSVAERNGVEVAELLTLLTMRVKRVLKVREELGRSKKLS